MYKEKLLDIIENKNVRVALISIKAELTTESEIETFKAEENYNPDIFLTLLKHEDAKIRKNDAIIMGLLREENFKDELIAAYKSDATLFNKSAYLKAIKNYAYQEDAKDLIERKEELESGKFEEKDLKHIAQELSVLREMFPEKREKHIFVNPSQPVMLILTTKKEASERLVCEVKKMQEVQEVQKMFLGVMFKTAKIKELSQIRTYKEILFPLNGLKPVGKNEIVKNIVHGNLLALLNILHESSKSPFGFRITSSRLDDAKIAKEIEALSKGRLRNAPSDYEIEIKIIENKDEQMISFLKLYTFKDMRFSYRKNVVSASIHPVNAAIVMDMVEDYLVDNGQILDPFCGVGTMLIERNQKKLARYNYGIDVFSQAIQGARENADASEVDINFINRNYFDFRHEYFFDEIITNMPRFEKEASDSFYRDFFLKSEEVLKDKGLIIMYSNEKNLVKKYMRINHNFKLIREFLFNEKEGYSVYVIMKLTEEG